jgi:predicted porin
VIVNRKLMAVAVASVLVAPAAFAQSGSVQLYGRLNGGLDYYKAPGATIGGAGAATDSSREGRFRVFDNSSRVGVRGTEDLGNGLKAIFQIETGVNIDNGQTQTGQGGQGNTSTGNWGTRDTWGGLQAGWGRITYGRQSMYWANGVNAQFSANYINAEIPWTNGTQLGRVSDGGIVAARVSNTIQYTSPTWAGNNFTLSWSPGGTPGGGQETVQAKSSSIEADGQVWAATWRGTFGPVYGQLDYANVKFNELGATAAGNPTPGLTFQQKGQLYKAGVSWGYMPGGRIGVIWVRTSQNRATGLLAGQTVRKDGYTINWEQTFGHIQALAQYGWTGDIKNCAAVDAVTCDNTSAKGFMLGGRYLLSKRTWLYLSYNQITNKSNDFIDYTGGAITSVNGAPAPYGADPRVLALGFHHDF